MKSNFPTVPDLIANAKAIKKFKRVIHEKLNVGEMPIYDIKAGDKALSYDPYNQGWYFAPTLNAEIGDDNNRDERYTNTDRRCYTCGSFAIDDLQAFEDCCKNLEDCSGRELLMITWGDRYDEFAMIIKDIYENNPKYILTSLEQRYKIAVNALINIVKGGCFYPNKKEAKTALQRLIYKTADEDKSITLGPDFKKELMKILAE
jgi:hypothetical protein